MPTIVSLRTAGSVIVVLALSMQPLCSVTVSVYIPADKPFIEVVVAPLLQLYVYGALPPVTFDTIEPLPLPLHVRSVGVSTTLAPELVTVVEAVSEHPNESLTVTVYVPAPRPVAVAVVAPFDHE